MTQNERYYRRVIGSIGMTLLLFLLLLNLFGVFLVFFSLFLSAFVPNETAYYVIYQTVYAAGYLASFMVPVALLKRLIGKGGYPYFSMQAPPKVSPWLPLMIPAAITLIFSAAYVNSALVDIFNYSAFSSDVIWGSTEGNTEPYRLVLDFIVICVVPGFCEEFLFRGAIMTNCMPFGRSNAILISALLFAIMHQNAEQIFFAFAAGIVLGVVYEKTGSIWNCTVLHILNNFISVFESAIFQKLGDLFASSVAVTLLEAGLFVLGTLCLLILIIKFFSQKRDLRNGVFGRSISELRTYSAYPIAQKRAVRLFFTPSMTVFISICALQVILLLFAAVFYVG